MCSMAGSGHPTGTSQAPTSPYKTFPPEFLTTSTPPYLSVTLPEWILQQLAAHVLSLSLKLASFQAGLCTFQEALTALGHLHCIQTPRLRTAPGQEAVMRDIRQENRKVITVLIVVSRPNCHAR